MNVYRRFLYIIIISFQELLLSSLILLFHSAQGLRVDCSPLATVAYPLCFCFYCQAFRVWSGWWIPWGCNGHIGLRTSDMAWNMCANRMDSKLMSWNVRPINKPAKLDKVFSHLRDQGGEIVYLQETHLLNKDHLKLYRGGFNQIYHSNFNSRSRGVALYTGMYNL